MKKSKIGHLTEEIPIHFLSNSSEELVSRLKSFFTWTRVFSGIPSISFFENLISTKTNSICTLLSLWNLVLLINQVFLLVNRLTKGEDFIRNSASEVIMRLHIICVHLWSLFYSTKFASVLKASSQIEYSRLKIYKEREFVASLKRKTVILIVIFLLLGIGLTLSSFLADYLMGESLSIVETWENYSEINCGLKSGFLFHPTISNIYCLISTFTSNFSWLFAEFLLIILAIILSEFFKRLNLGVENMEPSRFATYEIDLIREHHGLISKMVSDFDDAITVLNLINVGFNVAFIISGFYSVVVMKSRTNANMMREVFKLYVKLGVAIVKLVLSLIAGSLVHKRAQASTSIVRSWPMTREFQDLTINSNRIGIIQAFLSQLTKSPSTGFTIGKLVTITSCLLLTIPVAILVFFAFAKITISACTRRSNQ